MKFYPPLYISAVLLMNACGKPPSAGGGPPEGDFPMDVVGAPVTVDRLQETVRLVGTFEAPELLTVVSEVSGEVWQLPAAEGTRVQQGDLLVALDDTKLKARVDEVKSRLRLAASTLKRAQILRESSSISEQELDEAQASVDQARASIDLLEAELEDTRIHAAMDGVLGEHMVSPGQVVQAGQELMTLVKLDPLEISFEVPERYLAALKSGLNVQIVSDAYRDKTFEGEVVYLAPRLRTATRTLPVKALVPNEQGLLRPGMFGNVSLVLNENAQALFVPESAVQQQGGGTSVIVRNAQYRSEFRPVQIGVRQGGRIQILDGLAAEELVVAEGSMKVFFPGMLLNFTEDSRRYGLEPSMAPMPEAPAAPEGE
jgi:membrane fusion protein, multidrug efflux system